MEEEDSSYSSTIPSIFRNRHRNLEDTEEYDLISKFQETSLDGTDYCVVFHQKDLPNGAFSLMEDIRRQNHLIDVTILIGEKKHSIYAHKLVLASTIPYFHAMFTNDMVESKMSEITLDEHSQLGLDPGSFEALINFAYSGKVTISTSNVQSLMMVASFLMITRVRDACAEFLMARLKAFNVLGIRQFADSQGSSLLVNACNKFIRKQFSEVSETEEFLNLDIEEVGEIIGEDELYVISEQQGEFQ